VNASTIVPSLQRHSIKRKLMLIIMGVSTVALLLISGAFITYELFTFRKSMREDLQTLAQIIGDQGTAALTYDSEQDAVEILSALKARSHIVSASFYKAAKDKQFKLFAQYPEHPSPENQPPAVPPPLGSRFESKHLVNCQEVRDKGELLGVVYLKSDLLELHERLVRYTQIIIWFLALSLLITLLLSFWLQRIISTPIFRLAATARAVSSGQNYSLRAAKHAADELGELTDGFNEMLAQIQQRDTALQQAHDKLEKRVAERTSDLQAEVVERERAQDALKQQLTRISLLNQITHVVAKRQDLASIFHGVLRQLEEHLPVALGLICLYDAEHQQLTISALGERNSALAGKLDLRPGAELGLDRAGLARCQTGRSIYFPNVAQAPGELPRRLALAGLCCAVATSLTVEDKLFGILVVARTTADSFSSGECEFLNMLSEQVALAAHHARLHEQLERAYNDLRQSQQAAMQQDRLRALGQMASGIAHDVNNALSPIMGNAEMILNQELDLSPKARKRLNCILTASEDIAHFIARLRDFYRRREEVEPLLAVELNRLVEQVLEMTRPRWRDIPQGHGIMVELEPDLDENIPPIVGIESELREAVTNLILNAVDAMPQGGKLTLRTRLQAPPENEPALAARVVLEVEDTGIGMDEETRRRCLEPFFSTKGARGTGMGLAMAYGVMQRHDGKIEIRSEPGRGTTIRLSLPVREPPAIQPVVAAVTALTNPLRILCIDDEPMVRDIMKELLESDGHTVQVADSGTTGLEDFRFALRRKRSFNVVITDLGMPLMDGRQVAKTVKLEAPQTPVIMLTGWGSFMTADGEAPEYVDALLSKPPRLNQLREALAQVMRGA
jgi:signal transduction histidine kinase/ActR/RegA family two-component response regulator/HAMP domain-containing protein